MAVVRLNSAFKISCVVMLKRFLPSEVLLALNQDTTVLNRFKHIFQDQIILKELKNNQKLLDF